MKPWWQKFPRLLGWELNRLKEAGISYTLDKESFREGRGTLFLEIQTGEYAGCKFIVKFPSIYPYTRFQIFSKDFSLDHHQNPFTKNLCLIGRTPENWGNYSDDSIAKILLDQLPKITRTGIVEKPGPALLSEEEDQAEPFSEYYTDFQINSLLVVNGGFSIPGSVTGGLMEIGVNEPINKLQFVLLRIKDWDNNVIAENEPEYLNRKYKTVINGKWVRSPSPIIEDVAKEFTKSVVAMEPLMHPLPTGMYDKRFQLRIAGVLFPEEYARRRTKDGWIFSLRILDMKRKGKWIGDPFHTLIKASYSGRSDMESRIPYFNLLQGKKIALFGVGCLGAPSAIELAKCGVGELRILDCDHVDSGNYVRWPLGGRIIGKPKVEVLKNHIMNNFIFTKVIPENERLGDTPEVKKAKTDFEVVEEMLEGADLVFDATADFAIQNFLADQAKEKTIPYVGISVTPGIWGGMVVGIEPGVTEGCWVCLRHLIDDGTIKKPPIDPDGNVQATGCGDVTFTGSSFDALAISISGVRRAVSILTKDSVKGYPAVIGDVAIMSNRDEDDNLTETTWETSDINHHPNCSCQNNE